MNGKRWRGFADMDEEQVHAIARKGGRACSEDRQHMACIGSTGGIKSGKVRRANALRRQKVRASK